MDASDDVGVLNSALRQMQDRVEIYEVVALYCRGIDRRDYGLVRSAYHPDGVDHHAGFEGTVDDLIPWLEAQLNQYTSTSHLIGNHLASVVGNRAVAETYNVSVHRVTDLEDSRDFTVGVRYVDRMERRDGRWGIVERWALRDWMRLDAGRLGPLGTGPQGANGNEDTVYRALNWLKEQ